jgi:hypothetical protein
MIEIDDKIVSTDIITTKFLCDLNRCKGICCVEGNAGAPLEEDEARILAEEYPAYKPFLTGEGVVEIERQGFAVVDDDGDLVTPLIGDAQCAYSYKVDSSSLHLPRNDSRASSRTNVSDLHNSITLCAIEKAYIEGRTKFRKPVSCHLYPIRVVKFGNGTLGLNYHRWAVCEGAKTLGEAKGVPMYRMLREALERRFGAEFYEALEAADIYMNRH